jgi:hypothetical protein
MMKRSTSSSEESLLIALNALVKTWFNVRFFLHRLLVDA